MGMVVVGPGTYPAGKSDVRGSFSRAELRYAVFHRVVSAVGMGFLAGGDYRVLPVC